jgi:cellulose synthase/poly-beta-1,6-N-acetylglucosamine synthase-like glycosyltransferase/peptidoglycan/xylan/chitin deacetylase (PgdA/CDA1 family)
MKRALRICLVLAGLAALLALTLSFTVIGKPSLLMGARELDQQARAPDPLARNPVLAGQGPYLDLRDALASAVVPPRTVILTFDDGPSPEWTPAVQAVLDRHNVKGTFFVVGEEVVRHPEIVRALDRAGHEIGNHSYTHPRMGNLDNRRLDLQVSMTQQAVAGAIGKVPQLFRPPYSGVTTYFPPAEFDAATRISREHGLISVLSDRAPRDFDTSLSVSTLLAESMPALGQGAVITFHDGGGNRANTVAALDQLITILKANGYRFERGSDVLGGAPQVTKASFGDRTSGWFLIHSYSTVRALWTIGWAIGLVLVVITTLRVITLIALATHARHRERRTRPLNRFTEPVTVLIPAHNEAKCIEATVRSMVNSDHPDIQVIVVDDGSTDDTVAIVESLGIPNVEVIRQPNSGKFFALNMGLVRARHDIVIMVDADTVFEPSTITALIQPFRDPTVGAVAGNAKVGNRRGFLPRLQHIEYTISSAVERRMFTRLQTMGCIPGAVGAFRRRAIISVGGMSRETLAEDTDITMALARAGWKVPFAPKARAWTEVPTTLRGLYRQRLRWAYGILQAMTKHRRSVIERGASGRLGRRVILYQFVMGYLFTLAAPIIDVLVVYQLIIDGSQRTQALLLFAAVNVALMILAGYALVLEHERLRSVWILPLQQFVFRQVLYVAVLRSIMVALLGTKLPWHSVSREGAVAERWAQVFAEQAPFPPHSPYPPVAVPAESSNRVA